MKGHHPLIYVEIFALVAALGGSCFALGWYAGVKPSKFRTFITFAGAYSLGTLFIGIPLWVLGRAIYRKRHAI